MQSSEILRHKMILKGVLDRFASHTASPDAIERPLDSSLADDQEIREWVEHGNFSFDLEEKKAILGLKTSIKCPEL